jgi:hypothetical protein
MFQHSHTGTRWVGKNAENESWLAEMIEEAAVFRRQAHRGCEVLSLPSQDHQGLTQQHFCHHKHVVEVHGFRRLSEGCWGSNMDPWNLSIITKIHSFEFLFMSFLGDWAEVDLILKEKTVTD